MPNWNKEVGAAIEERPLMVPFAPTKDQMALGVGPPVVTNRRALHVCSTAMEKTGKTHWAMGIKGPVGVIGTDSGTKEIVEKFTPGTISSIPLNQRKPILYSEIRVKPMEETTKKEYEADWEKLKKTFYAMVADKRLRGLIVDTATEMWELCRLARFGKLTQVMPHHYGPVNAEFREMIKYAYDTRPDLNAIYIHKSKKEYKENKKGDSAWTGKYERGGFADFPFLVDANIEHYFNYESREFGIRVLDSRVNMLELVGQQFQGEFCDWRFLMMSAYPNESPSAWETA